MVSFATKLALTVALLACSCTPSHALIGSQLPLPRKHANSNGLGASEGASRPYGTNNATYGPVPEAEQLFDIEFLEIAPSPFLVYVEIENSAYRPWTKLPVC
jgi:hypothetical protein